LNYPPGNNRISGSGYTYDASGNITEDPSNQYAYDGEGRLCTVYNKTLFTYTGYAYDGLGNRVAKGTATNGINCDNTFTATSSFVVGPNGEQLDEMNATGAVYSNVFANGKLLATYQFPTSKWTFALNDWLGTKRFVANADGTKAETCTGLPFGDGPPCTGTGDPSPQHFTGKERDAETGFISGNDYFGARYYGSATGRFINPDWSAKLAAVPYAKLGNPQTLNLYSYVGNNPLSAVDPDGHDKTPGGTQCGQVVSIACNNPGDGPAGEAEAESRAAEAQYVVQVQQQSSSSGSGVWGRLGQRVNNFFHNNGFVTNAELDQVHGAFSSAYIVPGSVREIEPNSYVTLGLDAAGIGATLTGHAYAAGGIAAGSSIYNPDPMNLGLNGMSLVPGALGEAAMPLTVVNDAGGLAGGVITNNVMAPMLMSIPGNTMNDGYGHTVPTPEATCVASGMC
jgi:RHS repeat-associated protein